MDSTERAEQVKQMIREYLDDEIKHISEQVKPICKCLVEINDDVNAFRKSMQEAIHGLNAFTKTIEELTERFNIQYEPQTLDDILFPPDDSELKGGD